MVCPALVAGEQAGTGIQCTHIVLAELYWGRQESALEAGHRAQSLSLCAQRRSLCAEDTELYADPLLYPAESRSGRPLWQQARAVMVQKAAKRGQCILLGGSITFPNSPLSGRQCSGLFFLAEMFCLSSCLMNSFDSSNCLALLVGAAVWCGVLPEHQEGVKHSSRIFLGKGRVETLEAALAQTSGVLSPS